METVKVPDSLKDIFEYLEGETSDQKLVCLIVNDLKRRLQTCSQRIVKFEAKYGMRFEAFTQAWQAEEITNRYSHAVERDYMEWESLVDEYELLLSNLKKLKREVLSAS
jgi:translation initiation factor 2 alpha subunit (eIF-2alpha)